MLNPQQSAILKDIWGFDRLRPNQERTCFAAKVRKRLPRRDPHAFRGVRGLAEGESGM